jgi:apolipoprotein N-acyltransferase
MSYRLPSKPPTPSEYGVLVMTISGLLIILGSVALVMAVRAPESKQEAASAAMRLGLWSLGLGIGLAAIFWLHRRFVD